MANQITAIEKATATIEEILTTCNVTALAQMPALSQAVTLAAGINQLRSALTNEVMERVFMPLQSTPLGFLTDRDVLTKDQRAKMSEADIREWKPGYGVVVVRDCVIESLIHGLRPVGNEFNIISKRMYAAKNGLARRVSEYPGLTDLVITPGAPTLAQDKATARISMRASWKLNGNPMSLVRDFEKRADGTASDTRIEIRVNYGMGSDAIIGKAMRKTYRAILDLLTGSTLTLSDGDAIDTVGEVVTEPAPSPAAPEDDGRRMKMGAKPKSEPTHEPPAAPMREPGED